MRNHRAAVRIAFAVAVIVALSAYLSVLVSARRDRESEWRPDRFVERLGAEATSSRDTEREQATGYLDMGLDANATWRIAPPALPNDRRVATIVANDIFFAGPSAFVSIYVGGTRMLLVRPGTIHPHSAFRDEAPFVDVLAPPEPDRGFAFIIPAGNPCDASACSIEISTHAARWRIYRVGITEERAIDAVGEYR